MTQTGINRQKYAETHRATDPRPSRFASEGRDYAAWAARADARASQGTTAYPRKTDDGRTVWACCGSSADPACQHADRETLTAAALESYALLQTVGADPQTGRISSDPLRAAIPGDGLATAAALALAHSITGRKITRSPETPNTAPAARAALRRWAARQEAAR